MRQIVITKIIASLFALSLNSWIGEANAQTESDSSTLFTQVWIAEPGDTGLNRWNPRQLFEESGEVLDWNAKQLVFRRPGAKTSTTIPGDHVVRIEPRWADESLEKIHRMFFERQFQRVYIEGGTLINSVKDKGLPLWQVQVILAEIVESNSALGKPQLAARIFAALAKSKGEERIELPQLLLATIPLPWGETSLMDADLSTLRPFCEEWLASDTESLQLLGAAWLISGVKRANAIEKLESLARTAKSPIVSAYARVQLWRTVPPAEILSEHLPRWITERDKLLLPAQAGPTMLLADRLEKAGQSNLAIPEWLRIATLHADRYHLATKAISKASGALRSGGKNEEADQVQSLLDRFKIDDKIKK